MNDDRDRARKNGFFERGLVAAAALCFATVAWASSSNAQVAPDDSGAAAPAVSDAMLTPPPPAAREVKSWNEALALIRAHSPEYIASFESIRRAEGQSRIALAAVLPVLNAQATYVHQFLTESIPFNGITLVTPPPNTFAVNASLVWNVLSPRGIYGVGTAHRNEEAVKLSFEDKRRTIALSVVNSMLASLANARVAELNRVGLRAALERLTLTRTRLQFEQGAPVDVDRASQDVAAARAELIRGDEALRQSREALGVALGSREPVSAPGDLSLGDFESAVARTCHLNAELERRPDVAAARMRYEIAERGVKDAELMFAPSIAVSSQLQHTSVATLAPLTTWNVGAVLNVPLYDGGVRYGALKDTRAQREQALQALTATRLAAIVSAAQAARSVAVAQASRDVAMEQRDLAARIDQRTRAAYAQGAGTSLDLVLSAQALRNAEINLVLLEVQVSEARANAVLSNAECVY
jgi:multidrug efflux system outer membrane protein